MLDVRVCRRRRGRAEECECGIRAEIGHRLRMLVVGMQATILTKTIIIPQNVRNTRSTTCARRSFPPSAFDQ